MTTRPRPRPRPSVYLPERAPQQPPRLALRVRFGFRLPPPMSCGPRGAERAVAAAGSQTTSPREPVRPGRGAGVHKGRALAKQDHFPARAPVPLLCSSGKSGSDERKALESRPAPWSKPSGLDVPDYYYCCLCCEHEILPQGLLPRPPHLLLPPRVVICL